MDCPERPRRHRPEPAPWVVSGRLPGPHGSAGSGGRSAPTPAPGQSHQPDRLGSAHHRAQGPGPSRTQPGLPGFGPVPSRFAPATANPEPDQASASVARAAWPQALPGWPARAPIGRSGRPHRGRRPSSTARQAARSAWLQARRSARGCAGQTETPSQRRAAAWCRACCSVAAADPVGSARQIQRVPNGVRVNLQADLPALIQALCGARAAPRAQSRWRRPRARRLRVATAGASHR